MCPVVSACFTASFSPRSPTLHTPHLSVKFAVSVNWRAEWNLATRRAAASIAASVLELEAGRAVTSCDSEAPTLAATAKAS